MLILSGSFEDNVGTNVYFDIDKDDDPKNEKFDDQYKYLTKSDKILRMKRIFVEKSDNNTQKSTKTKKDKFSNDDEIQITHSYAQALNQFLKPGELPPRKTDEEDEQFFKRYGTLNYEISNTEKTQTNSIQMNKTDTIIQEDSIQMNKTEKIKNDD